MKCASKHRGQSGYGIHLLDEVEYPLHTGEMVNVKMGKVLLGTVIFCPGNQHVPPGGMILILEGENDFNYQNSKLFHGTGKPDAP